jgi:hypothetical protein
MSISIYRRHISAALDKASQETGWKHSTRVLQDGTGVFSMVRSPDVTEEEEDQEIIINFTREVDRPRFIQLELPFVEGENDDSDSE